MFATILSDCWEWAVGGATKIYVEDVAWSSLASVFKQQIITSQTREESGESGPPVGKNILVLEFVCYGWNGQNTGTNHMTIANTATVRIEPTLTKSKNR